jgi:hypothetical protein
MLEINANRAHDPTSISPSPARRAAGFVQQSSSVSFFALDFLPCWMKGSSPMLRIASFAGLCVLCWSAVADAQSLRVGFGESDITPPLREERPVWLAGYGQGRAATGVHDPLMARAVVLDDGRRKIALVSVDLIGLQYPETKRIRTQVEGFDYVLVASTHNHEGPDVIGIWGRSAFSRGVDDEYLTLVVDRVVEAIRAAESRMSETTAAFGTAEDENLLRDSRQPYVFDSVLRLLAFRDAASGQTTGLVVQWNCHPEALGSRNTLITADFPWATVAALKKRYNCPVVFFSGAVGGLLAPPGGRFNNEKGESLESGQFEFAQFYGEAVAELAAKAMERAEPITLSPFCVSSKPVAIPLENPVYGAARSIGVLRREGRRWTGNGEELGEPVGATETVEGRLAVETEVGYLRLGELHVAAIPGELYPELVYGRFQDPADPGADFPDAPLEEPVGKILPGEKWMLLGLANDEVGYIIPKRQWDQIPPFAYGRAKSQYGEINSCGPDVAPILMQALANRVREAAESKSGMTD